MLAVHQTKVYTRCLQYSTRRYRWGNFPRSNVKCLHCMAKDLEYIPRMWKKVIYQLKNVDGRFLIETPFIFLLGVAYKEVIKCQ